jgi:hypothetical protein
MGSVADAYDNSMAESFVSTLKRELIHRHSWPSRQRIRTAIFEYIGGFYNTRRRHAALGHLSPAKYEEPPPWPPPQPVVPRSTAPASPAPLSLRKSLRLTALGICSSFHLRSPQETRRARVGQ